MFLLRLAITIVVSALGYRYGRGIALAVQWPYFEALRATCAIVFGVMAALLAIVYPEVVKQGFRSGDKTDPGSAANLRILVDPLAHSAVLLMVVVLLGPIFALVSKSYPTSETMESISFASLCMLTTWQIWILLLVLRPLDVLRTHTERASVLKAAKQRIHEFPPKPAEKRNK